MNYRNFCLLLFVFCGVLGTTAKAGKIKYGKNIVYDGEMIKLQDEKVPSGPGILYLFSTDKKTPEILITGEFKTYEDDGVIVREAKGKIQSRVMGNFGFEGNINYSVTADKNSSVFALLLNGIFSDNELYANDSKTDFLSVRKLNLKFSYDKEQKVWHSQISEQTCELKTYTLPSDVSYWGYKDYNIGQVVSKVSYTDNRWSFEDYTFKFLDRSQYSDGKLSMADGSFFVLNGDDWYGEKIFDKATLVKNENSDKCQITYDNGDMYSGTIKADVQEIKKLNSIDSSQYVNGVSISNGKSEQWIDGESFTARHNRLVKFLDEDLVTAVENGSMTEAGAKIRQAELEKQREEERIAKVVNGLFAETDCVTFKGKGKGTQLESGDDLAPLGMESGEILYDCTLVLKADHTGTFTFAMSPSEEASYNQRIHYNRGGGAVRHYDYVAEFCNKLTSRAGTKSGEWTVTDNAIDLDGFTFELTDSPEKVIWKLFESVPMTLDTSSASNTATAAKQNYPKSLVGRTYAGNVNMGEIDEYVTTKMSLKFKNANTIQAHYSMTPMNDTGVKMLMEMFEPGVTEGDKTFKYTYSNGIVKIKDSNETCTLKNNNKILYWHASDTMNGNLYLK